MSKLLVDIAELAEELCDARPHTEHVYDWDHNRNRKSRPVVTVQEGLLAQLRKAIQPSQTGDEGRSVPRSRPPLLLEALDRHIAITTAVNEWIHDLRLENRTAVEANIRSLVGATSRLDYDGTHALRRDLRHWRTWAAVMSGWELPPFTPFVPCPKLNCGAKGRLRIDPTRKTGFCTNCKTVWDELDGSIGILATYISAETEKPHLRIPIRSGTEGHGGWAERRSTPDESA